MNRSKVLHRWRRLHGMTRPAADPVPAPEAARVRTPHILFARLVAAALNVAPPLVGSYALGRESYGMVASVLAIATIVFGPVSQILSQNLLRLLCTAQQAERAVGASLLFCTGCICAVGLLHLLGAVSDIDAPQLAILIVSLTLLRICEVQLISAERLVSSIMVFYAAPPLLSSVFYLVAAYVGGGHAAGAAAQSVAYCVAAVLACHAAKGVRSLLVQALATPVTAAAHELARSTSLLVSGAASAAADFLPVVLLRGLGAFAVIPVYEIARKIASVPTTLANPLLNQMNPAIIRAYASENRHEIQRLLRRIFQLLFYAGIVFLVFVAMTLIAGSYIPRIEDVAELLVPLSLGTIVAMWCVPYQSLLIAARGDHWFSVSSGVSVILLLGLTYLCSALGPGLAVSWAVGLSVAASGLIVRYRAMKEA
jgi:O-antigen/teichoic acid export membrane protein